MTKTTNQSITPQLSSELLPGTFPGNLDIELTEITDEHVRGRMLVDKRHLHPMGYVHGGAWVAFADTVAAWGTMRHLPEGKGFTTVELKVNVLASAQDGDELTALGEPLHSVRARTSGRCRCFAASAWPRTSSARRSCSSCPRRRRARRRTPRPRCSRAGRCAPATWASTS